MNVFIFPAMVLKVTYAECFVQYRFIGSFSHLLKIVYAVVEPNHVYTQ